MAPKREHGKKGNPKPHGDSQEMRTLDESSQAAAELTTRRIGQFEVLEVLGQGAFGAVYHAQDTVLEREVAIKVPHASRITTQEMRQRFLREARSAAGLRHPHICPVFEVGEENDTPYIVMAFIKGQELSAVLKRRGHLTDRQSAVMVRRLALALEFAHQQGIVHRDLKPDNIMIDQDRKEPVIMDFGLARVERGDESALTQEGQLMGTPVYMPPEQARGDMAQIGPASDVYSLGVILYELLCGRRPHEGSLAEVLSKVLTVDPEPPSAIREDINPSLEAICRKAIARDIDNRYCSMAEFASELTDFLKSDGGQASEPVMPIADARQGSPENSETVVSQVSETTDAAGRSGSAVQRRPSSRVKVMAVAAAVVLTLIILMLSPWTSSSPDGDGQSDPPDVTPLKNNRVREFVGNSETIVGVGLSPDNKLIASCTSRGTILVWHRDEAQPRLDKNVARFFKRRLQFAQDSQSILVHNAFSVLQIAIADGTVTNQLMKKGQSHPTFSRISRSGIVYVNRIIKGEVVISKRDKSSEVESARISNAGDYTAWSAVLPESEVFLAVQKEGGIHFWNCNRKFTSRKGAELTDDDVTMATGHDSLPTCLAWSADEQVAATADSNGNVILWDVPNRKELRRLDAHSSTVHSIALSPDGTRLLTGCGNVARQATRDDLQDDYSIRLWDVETAKLVAVVGTHRDSVTDLSFGGDSSEAVSCSNDNTVCLWKLPQKKSASVSE